MLILIIMFQDKLSCEIEQFGLMHNYLCIWYCTFIINIGITCGIQREQKKHTLVHFEAYKKTSNYEKGHKTTNSMQSMWRNFLVQFEGMLYPWISIPLGKEEQSFPTYMREVSYSYGISVKKTS